MVEKKLVSGGGTRKGWGVGQIREELSIIFIHVIDIIFEI